MLMGYMLYLLIQAVQLSFFLLYLFILKNSSYLRLSYIIMVANCQQQHKIVYIVKGTVTNFI